MWIARLVIVILATHTAALADDRCRVFYAEPTLAIGATKYLSGDILEGGVVVLNRAALGAHLLPCENAIQLRLGAALVFATGDLRHSSSLGFGLETEISFRFRDGLRLGARIGIDSHSGAGSAGGTSMPMFGVRARIHDRVALGVDVFYVDYSSELWGRSTSFGAMGTIALDGPPGVIAGSVNAGLLVLGFALGLLRAGSGA